MYVFPSHCRYFDNDNNKDMQDAQRQNHGDHDLAAAFRIFFNILLKLVRAGRAALYNRGCSSRCATFLIRMSRSLHLLVSMVFAVSAAAATLFWGIASPEAVIVPLTDTLADILTYLKVALECWVAHVGLLRGNHNDLLRRMRHHTWRHHLLLLLYHHHLLLLLHG